MPATAATIDPSVVVFRILPDEIPVIENDVVVALVRSDEPESVVEAMIADRLALSWPPTLSTPPMVEDAVTESAEVVAEVAERLRSVVSPVLLTEKWVLCAPLLEVEAIAKSVVVAVLEAACIEK